MVRYFGSRLGAYNKQSNRQEYSDLTRFFTGHNNLNRHIHLLNETDTAECRLCLEDEESSDHLLFHTLQLAAHATDSLVLEASLGHPVGLCLLVELAVSSF